jgi:hypothetical protein
MLISRRLFVAFVLATALIGSASEAQSRRKSPYDMRPQKAAKTEHRTQEDKRGTDEHPLSVNVIPTPEQKADAEKENASAKLNATDDRKLVEYTRDLVVVGIVQFAVFVLQFVAFVTQAIYMRRTVTEMQNATGAAIRAAKAAEDTIGHMRKTAEQQLRAYLSIDSGMRKGDHTFTPKFKLRFKNCGQTPAYKGEGWVDIQVREYPLTSDLVPSENKMINRFEMPPTNGFSARQINADNVATIANRSGEFDVGRIAFYIFGELNFVDAFDEPRWLKYRFRYGNDCMGDGSLALDEIKSN